MSINIKEVSIRCTAASECLAAAEDLKKDNNIYNYEIHNSTINLLNNLSINLSVVSDEEMKYVQEIRELAGTGNLLKDARIYAIKEVKVAIAKTAGEKTPQSILSSIENLAIDAINAKYSTDGTRTKYIKSVDVKSGTENKISNTIKRNTAGFFKQNIKLTILSSIIAIIIIAIIGYNAGMSWKIKTSNAELGYRMMWSINEKTRPETIAISPDGKYTAAGFYDFVKIYDTKTGDEIFTVIGIDSKFKNIRSLSFSSDGQYIAAGADKLFFYIIETKSGQIVKYGECMSKDQNGNLTEYIGNIDTIGYMIDDKRLFLQSNAEYSYIFNYSDFSMLHKGKNLESARICPDKKNVICSELSYSGNIFLLDTETFKERELTFAPIKKYYNAHISSDMKKIYMIERKKATDIVVFDISSGKEISRIRLNLKRPLEEYMQNVYEIDYSSGNFIIIDLNEMLIVNSISGKEIGRLKDDSMFEDTYILEAVVDLSGNIFVHGIDNRIALWKKESRESL